MPVLSSLVPDLDKKFTTAFDNISFLHEFAMHSIENWKETNSIVKDNGEIFLSLQTIRREENPVQFLSFLLYSYGITDIDCRQILEHNEPGGLFVSKNYELLRDRQFLILRPKQEKIHPEIAVTEIPAAIHAGERDVRFTYKAAQQFAGKQEKYQQIDAEKIALPLTIRPWKQGDYFYPLGMTGRKKVSDYFIDQKINLFEKENTFLLLSGSDIVCILGHRIDDRYKVTDNTKKILNIELL
jgi:tRNA(Ile)-lysidine synthase